jgi:hypothetical protein
MPDKNLDDIFNLRARFPTEEENREFERAVRSNDIARIERALENWPGAAAEWRSYDHKPIITDSYNYITGETLAFLLSRGADINRPDDDGNWPPLVHCAFLSSADKLEMLIRHGADIHAKTKYGQNAAMMAVDGKRYDCLDLLVLCSARLDEKDNFGKTANDLLEKDAKARAIVYKAQERLKEFLAGQPQAGTAAAAPAEEGIPAMKVIVLKNARTNAKGEKTLHLGEADPPSTDKNGTPGKNGGFWKKIGL